VGVSVGIYSDFFAMQYWSESFGFYAVSACVTLFVTGHLLLFFVDKLLVKDVLSRLREKVRRMEMKGFK
jgi:hypothetical protein